MCARIVWHGTRWLLKHSTAATILFWLAGALGAGAWAVGDGFPAAGCGAVPAAGGATGFALAWPKAGAATHNASSSPKEKDRGKRRRFTETSSSPKCRAS